ncbi:hypothetical protein [Subtercola vilae]|uniref:Uncharacterized protein n=1 Tax=Subtercola vilae TaxID=2056433 RepID=A0A4V4RE04_9MICO|nr:hypothetical protein [Subtercola vilae]TIH32284.1 hypothetical protein D4765_15700 [Subtercola vilae]
MTMPSIPNRAATLLSMDDQLATVASVISSSWQLEADVDLVVERLVYLSSGGLVRVERAEVAKAIALSAIAIFIEDVRHSSPTGELNWFRLAQILGTSPREARAFFSRAKS